MRAAIRSGRGVDVVRALSGRGRCRQGAACIDDDLFERLRASFSDAEVLDLTMCIAVYLGLGRALEVLGIDASGAIDI